MKTYFLGLVVFLAFLILNKEIVCEEVTFDGIVPFATEKNGIDKDGVLVGKSFIWNDGKKIEIFNAYLVGSEHIYRMDVENTFPVWPVASLSAAHYVRPAFTDSSLLSLDESGVKTWQPFKDGEAFLTNTLSENLSKYILRPITTKRASAPVISDYNGDGEEWDIVLALWAGKKKASKPKFLQIIRADAKTPGVMKALKDISKIKKVKFKRMFTLVGDFTGDGQSEIAVVSDFTQAKKKKKSLYHVVISSLEGQILGISKVKAHKKARMLRVIAADVDNNGDLEIVYATTKGLYVVDYKKELGMQVKGLLVSNTRNIVAVGFGHYDINSIPEYICLQNEGSLMRLTGYNDLFNKGWSVDLPAGGSGHVSSNILMTDYDGDGSTDAVVGYGNRIYAVALKGENHVIEEILLPGSLTSNLVVAGIRLYVIVNHNRVIVYSISGKPYSTLDGEFYRNAQNTGILQNNLFMGPIVPTPFPNNPVGGAPPAFPFQVPEEVII